MLSLRRCCAHTRAAGRHLVSSKASPRTDPQIQNAIYVSESSDPYFNLTFEDWLFRRSPPEKPLLFLYRNNPCVVIGRNQNPWKEVNFRALRAAGNVSFLRRRSGGGTVYHDLGNTNFSIHLPRRAFDRQTTGALILRAVTTLDIPGVRLNDRNDICVADDKVSGSAYKITTGRAYHHGTMLISTRLDTLGDLLRVEGKETMQTNGVASVRSPVCNIRQTQPDVTHSAFVDAVVSQFQQEYDIDDKPLTVDESWDVDSEFMSSGIDELQGWDWLYGQTPFFTYTLEREFAWGTLRAEVSSKHGMIMSCSLSAPQAPSAVQQALHALGKSAEAKAYGQWPQAETDQYPELLEVGLWLKEAFQ
ncbi:unnamed protein product [Mycena citricolor]|uniref:Putative lipoate-protein ligase A n=1 Tax=Mycena citricolor TaxID=2018698 RepID=A0AAD2HSA7_9AGAR|nr:unnamed protein product [Mycena citricolor]